MPSTSFNPKSVLEAFREHHITHVVMVPFQLHMLAKDDSFSVEKTASVKRMFLGGDIISKEILQKGQRCFPTATVANAHGMTEGGACIYWPYNDLRIDAIPEYGGIAVMGKVGPGCALRIYDIENDRVARRNESGEFQICGPATIKNYLENENQEAFVQEGAERWFRTGDVGFINEDGALFLLGRMNDRIKRAGIRIEPAALETSIGIFLGTQVSLHGVVKLSKISLCSCSSVAGFRLWCSASRARTGTLCCGRELQRCIRRARETPCD